MGIPHEGARSAPTTEDHRWEREAQDARHSSLDHVRAGAEKWVGGIAGLLGVAASVSLFKVPDIKTISTGWSWVLLASMGVAALFALGGLVLANLASQGTPQWYDVLDGVALRRHIEERTPQAIRHLRTSRWLISASATILIASVFAATAQSLTASESPLQKYLVVFEGKPAVCGPLSVDKRGAVVVKGQALEGPAHLVALERCP